MTLATGLFSASAARTMNKNIEEKIRYKNGADIVLQTKWENDAPPPQSGPPGSPEKRALFHLLRSESNIPSLLSCPTHSWQV